MTPLIYGYTSEQMEPKEREFFCTLLPDKSRSVPHKAARRPSLPAVAFISIFQLHTYMITNHRLFPRFPMYTVKVSIRYIDDTKLSELLKTRFGGQNYSAIVRICCIGREKGLTFSRRRMEYGLLRRLNP